jgi:redox-regulated HSP33 family molecular chaperone
MKNEIQLIFKTDKNRYYISDKIKVKIIKKQHFLCKCCHKKVNGFILQLHHKDANPFNDSLKNLEAVCVKCHEKISLKYKKMRTPALLIFWQKSRP